MASSLSSSECFVLQSGNALFTWHGNASSFEQQQWVAKVAEFLKVCMVPFYSLFLTDLFVGTASFLSSEALIGMATLQSAVATF